MSKTFDLANSVNENSIPGSRISDGSITNQEINSSVEIGAEKVPFIGIGADAPRSTQSRLRDSLSVLDFIPEAQHEAIRNGTSTYDATSDINTAIAESISQRRALFFPSGSYLVTDTLPINEYTQIHGETRIPLTRSFGQEPDVATVIKFEPVASKTLFQYSGSTTGGTYRYGIVIDGFYLRGNTVSLGGNSSVAIDCIGGLNSQIKNIGISNFETGIRIQTSLNCAFERVDINTCSIRNVLYASGTATTDVWNQCYIHQSPIGIEDLGTNLAIRFHHCIFENLNVGLTLSKSSFGWSFTENYIENVPAASGAPFSGGPDPNGCMFRVGYTGPSLSEAVQLTVNGGVIGGPIGVGVFGSAFDIDEINGVHIGGCEITRYATGIKTGVTTRANSIIGSGISRLNVTALATDLSKLTGFFPVSSSSASGQYQQQFANLRRVVADEVWGDSSGGGTLSLNAGFVYMATNTTSYVLPVSDNLTTLGLLANRWSTIYAATPTIVTSDGREKLEIAELEETERLVAKSIKHLIRRFKYADAVKEKGEGARLHFGVIAQEVIEAFEAHGLDPMRYGVVCYDAWDPLIDEDGNEVKAGGSRYGIRYEELVMFMLSAL